MRPNAYRAFSRRLDAASVSVNAMAPGLVLGTSLYRHLTPEAKRGLEEYGDRSVTEGAETAIWLASAPELTGPLSQPIRPTARGLSMRRRILTTLGLATALAISSMAGPAFASESNTRAQLGQVRAATEQYHRLDAALADGYELASPCVPQMGFHYVRSVAADETELDVTGPNSLVYAPLPNGKVRLVAVEYASWDPATLFGQAFDAPHDGGPPFYTLHAWVWQANPAGLFTDLNPNISCDV